MLMIVERVALETANPVSRNEILRVDDRRDVPPEVHEGHRQEEEREGPDPASIAGSLRGQGRGRSESAGCPLAYPSLGDEEHGDHGNDHDRRRHEKEAALGKPPALVAPAEPVVERTPGPHAEYPAQPAKGLQVSLDRGAPRRGICIGDVRAPPDVRHGPEHLDDREAPDDHEACRVPVRRPVVQEPQQDRPHGSQQLPDDDEGSSLLEPVRQPAPDEGLEEDVEEHGHSGEQAGLGDSAARGSSAGRWRGSCRTGPGGTWQTPGMSTVRRTASLRR